MLVEPGNRDGVLDAAARLLADASPATAAIGDSLRSREKLGSTAIGHGIAIPHGRTDAYDETRGAFLRLQQAVDFGASDGEPVDLVFAMAVPEHFTQQHLQLLSELAERFADPGFRAALRAAPDVRQPAQRLLLGARPHRDRHERTHHCPRAVRAAAANGSACAGSPASAARTACWKRWTPSRAGRRWPATSTSSIRTRCRSSAPRNWPGSTASIRGSAGKRSRRSSSSARWRW